MIPAIVKPLYRVMRWRSGEDVPILIYHRVAPMGRVTLLPVFALEIFEQHIKWLSQYLQPFTLAEAGDALARGGLPANAVVVTIDDGYDDCYEHIFPVLRRYGVPATFFVATGGMRTGRLWDERIAQAIIEAPVAVAQVELLGEHFSLQTYAERLHCAQVLIERLKYQPMAVRAGMMEEVEQAVGVPPAVHQFVSADQVREMAAAGMEFGAHTLNHPILALEDDQTAREEIVQSKAELEDVLQQPVRSFAYPNGKFGKDFGQHHIEMVRQAGFDYAVSSDLPGTERFAEQPLCLGRKIAWAGSQARFILGICRVRAQ